MAQNMLTALIQQVASTPVHVIVDQAPKGLSEFQKTLISASVGAVAAILGNFVIEFYKPRIANRGLKKLIASQLLGEVKGNLERLRYLRTASREDYTHPAITMPDGTPDIEERPYTGLKNDRYEHYRKTEELLVAEIDRNQSLSMLDMYCGGLADRIIDKEEIQSEVESAIEYAEKFVLEQKPALVRLYKAARKIYLEDIKGYYS